MKKILFAVFAAAFCASAVIGGGCGAKKYAIYTNAPKERLDIISGNFYVAEQIYGEYAFKSGVAAENKDGFGNRTQDFYAMNERATLTVSDVFSAERIKDFENLCAEISQTLESLENSLSVKIENSYISAFNKAAAGERVELDQTAYNVLNTALKISELTEGYYNPAVYYSVERFGFNNNFNYPKSAEELPKTAELDKYKELSTHFKDVAIYAENGTYYAVKPNFTVETGGENLSLKIDLGGVGKGYAADVVDELLKKYSFDFGYFSFGTSSIVCKNHYRAADYTLDFVNPRANAFGAPYMRMKLASDKIATSGDYEQYYILDGVRYCHIIDPFTAAPVQTGIMTATVIGGSAAENDALATAIIAMGTERAKQFIENELADRLAVFTVE